MVEEPLDFRCHLRAGVRDVPWGLDPDDPDRNRGNRHELPAFGDRESVL